MPSLFGFPEQREFAMAPLDQEAQEVYRADAALIVGAIKKYARPRRTIRRLETELAQEQAASRELKHKATHDKLTGCLNLEGLMEYLETHPRPVALLLIDGTNQKEVNERFGYARGDESIVATAEVIKAALRPSDQVARVGGDEFIALIADERWQTGNPTGQPDAERRLIDNDIAAPDTVLASTIGRVREETGAFLTKPENQDLVNMGFDIAVGGSLWAEDTFLESAKATAEIALKSDKAIQHSSHGQYR